MRGCKCTRVSLKKRIYGSVSNVYAFFHAHAQRQSNPLRAVLRGVQLRQLCGAGSGLFYLEVCCLYEIGSHVLGAGSHLQASKTAEEKAAVEESIRALTDQVAPVAMPTSFTLNCCKKTVHCWAHSQPEKVPDCQEIFQTIPGRFEKLHPLFNILPNIWAIDFACFEYTIQWERRW